MNDERLNRLLKQEITALKTENYQLRKQMAETLQIMGKKDEEILRLLNQLSNDMIRRSDVDQMVKAAVEGTSEKYEKLMKAMAAEYEAKIAEQKKPKSKGKDDGKPKTPKGPGKTNVKTYDTKEEALAALQSEVLKAAAMADQAFGKHCEKLTAEQVDVVDPVTENADDDTLVHAPIEPRGNYGIKDYEPKPRAKEYCNYMEKPIEDVEYNNYYPEGCDENSTIYGVREKEVYELTLPKLRKVVNRFFRCMVKGKKVWAKAENSVLGSSHFGPKYTAYLLLGKYLNGMAELKSEVMLKYQTGMEVARTTINTHVNNVLSNLRVLMGPRLCWWVNSSDYSAIDETTEGVFVEGEDGKLHLRTRYIWAVRSNEPSLVYYIYDKGSRSRKVILDFLKDFIGTIQTDGATMYKIFEKDPTLKITRLSCLVHIRRYFYKALKFEDETGIASWFLNMIKEIYKKEKEYAKLHLSNEEVKNRRKEEIIPILGTIWQKLTAFANDATHQCGELLTKAINYAIAEWKGLIRYTEDGKYRPDNNYAEQCMRGIACGRKNFLFSGSDAAAANLAFAYSLTESCKLCKVNPYEYWTDLLASANKPGFNVDDFMPHLWHKKIKNENN